jgi:SpoU rRNA methylase family enzyme
MGRGFVRSRGVSRLSQAIAEGDGISVLVEVADGPAAGTAERQGADGLVIRHGATEVRSASQLPLLYVGRVADAHGAAADGLVVAADAKAWGEAGRLGLERVVRVVRTDDLERALDELDPEIFLLSADPESEEDALELLLALLHDVPAGKLAIAELHDATREDVEELERAGVDAVLVTAGDVAALVPVEPPEV